MLFQCRIYLTIKIKNCICHIQIHWRCSAQCAKNNNTDKTNWRDQNQNFYIIYNYSKKKRPAGMRNITKYIKGSEKCKKYEYRYICI